MFCCISSKIIAVSIGKQNPFCKPPCGGWRIAVNYLQTTIPPTQYRFVQYDLTSPSSLKLTPFSEESLVLFLGVWGVATSHLSLNCRSTFGRIRQGNAFLYKKEQEIPRLHKNSNTGNPPGWMAHTESMRLEIIYLHELSVDFLLGTCREKNYTSPMDGMGYDIFGRAVPN